MNINNDMNMNMMQPTDTDNGGDNNLPPMNRLKDPPENAALFGIEYPGVHDVLCGRGGHAMTHPGNLKFRTLIDSFKPRYDEAAKHEKSTMASHVVTLWRSQIPMGRFLTKTEPLNQDSLWEDIGHKAALKKVAQALRERRSYPMIAPVAMAKRSHSPTSNDPHNFHQQEPLPSMYQDHPPSANPHSLHAPPVDAIITLAQQQEQLEKIRQIEAEIEMLKKQNYTQQQIENQLRQQQQQPQQAMPNEQQIQQQLLRQQPPPPPAIQQQLPGNNEHRITPDSTPEPMDITSTKETIDTVNAVSSHYLDVMLPPLAEHTESEGMWSMGPPPAMPEPSGMGSMGPPPTGSMGPPPPMPPKAPPAYQDSVDTGFSFAKIFEHQPRHRVLRNVSRGSNGSNSAHSAGGAKMMPSEGSSARRLMNESIGSFSSCTESSSQQGDKPMADCPGRRHMRLEGNNSGA